MLWTPTTPLYLPLVYPASLLAAAHRLARDVATRFGAAPPLRPQPAPLGGSGILIGPDPAYTGGVAPQSPGTFAVQANAHELIVTGADPLGTNLGLGWLAVHVLGLSPCGQAADAEAGPIEVTLDYRLPPWPPGPRGWRLDPAEAAALDHGAAWDVCEALLRSGGDALDSGHGPARTLASIATEAGLRWAADLPGPVVRCEMIAAARAPVWWPPQPRFTP